MIHTLVLPYLLTEGENPLLSVFIRHIIEYLHNGLVSQDSSDPEHLPDFSSMDGAGDIFALFVLSMLMNAFDARTYQVPVEFGELSHDDILLRQQVFDLNAIPVIERHKMCHTRGLALDLVLWFFEKYEFTDHTSDEEVIDGLHIILIPFTAHIARQTIRYKRLADKCGHDGIGSPQQIKDQIELALFQIPELKDAYHQELAAEEEKGYYSDASSTKSVYSDFYNLDYDFTRYTIKERQLSEDPKSQLDNFIEHGQNLADKRFFKGLLCQFDLNHDGNNLICYFHCYENINDY